MGKTLGKILIILTVILTAAFVALQPSLAAEKLTIGGGEIANDGRFVAFNDGTVLDTKTNLLWAAKDNGKSINWTDARFYCENYKGGGYKDWRMPTRDELLGIYNDLIWNNGHHLTKLITLTESYPWASESKGKEAAYVSFDYSQPSWCWSSMSYKSRGRALPVRYGREIKKAVIEKKPEPVVVAVAPPPPPPPPVVTAPPPPPPPPPVQKKVVVSLNVEFDTGKSVIKEKYYDDIKKIADFMQKYSDTNVVIEGHTDNVNRSNNPDLNVKLSQSRANSVRQYLIENFGIDASRVTSVGYGPDKPIASNDTDEGRQKNRRIDAVVETIITI